MRKDINEGKMKFDSEVYLIRYNHPASSYKPIRRYAYNTSKINIENDDEINTIYSMRVIDIISEMQSMNSIIKNRERLNAIEKNDEN